MQIKLDPYVGEIGTIVSHDKANQATLGVMYWVELPGVKDIQDKPMRVIYTRAGIEPRG